MRVRVKNCAQLSTPAMSQFERFQSGVEPALLFVEQAIEQEDRGFQLVWRNLQSRGIHQGGDGLDAAACQELPAAAERIAGSIEIELENELPPPPALLYNVT